MSMTNRHITFAGKNSLDDFGARISSERSSGAGLAGQRTSTQTVSFRDGDYVQRAGLASARLAYCFVIHGSGRADCEAKMRALHMWLCSAKGDLIDSDYPGKKYTGVCVTDEPETEWVSRAFRNAYLTEHLTADPCLQDINAVNERVLQLTAAGGAAITITNNSAYSITAGGVTTTGSISVNSPYTYRLEISAENPETVTLNGDPISAGEIFTMPSAASISVSYSGYGYIALWHDTREVIRQ